MECIFSKLGRRVVTRNWKRVYWESLLKKVYCLNTPIPSTLAKLGRLNMVLVEYPVPYLSAPFNFKGMFLSSAIFS